MNEVTELVRERVGIIVTRGLDSYGYFRVEEEKRKFYDVAINLLLSITDRIDRNDVITLTPLRNELAVGVFILGLDKELTRTLFNLISNSLHDEVKNSSLVDPDTENLYRKYWKLLSDALTDINNLLTSKIPEYLSNIPEYSTSDSVVELPPTKSRLLKSNRTKDIKSKYTYNSRLTSRFSEVFNLSVTNKANVVSSASADINSITSDSQVDTDFPSIDESLLTATFAGEGSKVYSDIKKLYAFAMEFGGYQGSLVGAVDYQSRYYEYLMAMSYGKRLQGGIIGGEFGEFEAIFEAQTTETSIPGLKFLEPLYITRSGNQSNKRSNPVADKYRNGISSRYNPVSINPDLPDFVSLTLESTYLLCLRIGDAVRSLLNRPPEGIGHTTVHLDALSKIFPQSYDVRERSTGFTGAIGSLLSAHRSLYSLLGYEPNLFNFGDKLRTMSGLVSSLVSTLRDIGFKPGGHVPSLSLTIYEPDRDKISKKLEKIGFNSVEVQEIMGVKSVKDLLNKFAPLTDSQDVISFFRAYDLTKLLYEFGGQSAIDHYIDFLYGVNSETSILKLLELLDKSRSMASKVRGSEFSRLIGYIVTLTYAVDPSQLSRYESILKRNNLDLFQSITSLIEQGIPSLIKDRKSVSLLSGMVAQMVTLDNSGYDNQKPLWNDLIEKSTGNIGESIENLYNNTEGITPTELHSFLNNPSAMSPLGKMLDGVKGGQLTSLLRYCNLFGLLYTLSSYRNSGQLTNQLADNYVLVLELLDNLEALSERLQIANIVLDENSDYSVATSNYTEPLVQVQNKKFEALVDLISGRNFSTQPILESPGIGNSRIPNGVRVSNSLTPEEAAIISNTGNSLGIFTKTPINPVDSGSYIRIAVSNLLANGVVLGVTESPSVDKSPDGALNPIQDYSTTYVNSDSTTSDDPLNSVPPFNPVLSCQRFGGINCSELGENSDQICPNKFSKALLPEAGYGEQPISSSTGVSIDRALGAQLSEKTTYNGVSPTHPQRSFSAEGLSSFSRSEVGKNNEMLCASLKDPYEYGACISLLKCKKFNPPYLGRYSFAFCPSTLHGGRLRK